MATSAAERRAARKRKERQRAFRRPAVQEDASDLGLVIGRLVVRGAATDDPREFQQATTDLARLDPGVDPAGHASRLLVGLLRQLWERGWQPANVVHVVRRNESRRVTGLLVAAIAEEARIADAAGRAAEEWLEELSAIDTASSSGTGFVAARARAEGLPPLTAWRETLGLVESLEHLGPLHELAPPPSR